MTLAEDRRLDPHEIRLRGGWKCEPTDGLGREPTRLTLPAPQRSLPAGELRLTRRFHRPPGIETHPVRLRLRRVSGIQSVLLNGLPIGPISPERSEFELTLGKLAPRNELVMLANPAAADDEWGVISLVFGGPEPGGEEAEPTARPG